MHTPRVAILMPVYEPNAAHLRDAIDSVLAQTEKNWTLLIHDDASQADVQKMVESYLQDPHITFFRSSERLGIGGNWNATLKQANTQAPFVQYLFQDDAWDPGYLTRAIEALEKAPSAGMAVTQHRYQMEGNVTETDGYERVLALRKALKEGKHDGKAFLFDWLDRGLRPNIVGEPSFVLLRRELLQSVGPFNETLPQLLDVEYWVHCLQQTDMLFIGEDGGFFRVHPEGASARNRREGKGLVDRLKLLERLTKTLSDTQARKRARKALSYALSVMLGDYLRHKKEGGKVDGSSGGEAKAFALRHPFLMLKALIKAWQNRA